MNSIFVSLSLNGNPVKAVSSKDGDQELIMLQCCDGFNAHVSMSKEKALEVIRALENAVHNLNAL